MREKNVVFKKKENQLVDVEYTSVKQDFHTIFENKSSRTIEVCIVYLDVNNNPIEYQRFDITGENYNLLMSESPYFAEGKPENEYREIDLWYIIDSIRE